jgi:hypothetical protein
MDIKLDFDPKEIAEKMHEAIISSTFKEIFSKAVTEECKRLTEANWNTNSIIQNSVRNYFEITIHSMLNTEYKEQIENVIREKITKERLETLCEELVQKIKVQNY